MTFRIPTETNLAEVDQLIGKAKTQKNNDTRQFNIKGINHCYNTECNSNNLDYDSNRDEVYCKDCGTVLRQGFTDNQDIILRALKNETLSQNYDHKIDYFQDLMRQTETEVLGTV